METMLVIGAMNSVVAQVSEQLSMFSLDQNEKEIAVCCEDGDTLLAQQPEEWMMKLVPGGERVVYVGKYPLVLRPAPTCAENIPTGHRYYHYQIDGQVYSGIFVGRSVQYDGLFEEEQSEGNDDEPQS